MVYTTEVPTYTNNDKAIYESSLTQAIAKLCQKFQLQTYVGLEIEVLGPILSARDGLVRPRHSGNAQYAIWHALCDHTNFINI